MYLQYISLEGLVKKKTKQMATTNKSLTWRYNVGMDYWCIKSYRILVSSCTLFHVNDGAFLRVIY